MTTAEEMSVSNRQVAGVLLSKKLREHANSGAVVLGISRGGMVVAASVAKTLGLPLHALPCRKLIHPGDSKESIGSVSLEEVVLNNNCGSIPRDYISHQLILVRNSLRNELKVYQKELPAVSVRYKTVIVIDDLSSSGNTLLACLKPIKKQLPLKVIVAVPFISAKAARLAGETADEVVFIRMDQEIGSPRDFYTDFPEVSVENVKDILSQVSHEQVPC